MKKYFYSGSVKGVSIFTGIICFIIASFFIETIWAILFSLIFALLLSLTLPFVLYFADKRYERIENEIDEAILLKKNVNFRHGNMIRNGYIFITENKLHFFSRDKRPFIYKCICKREVLSLELKKGVILNIYSTEYEVYTFESAECKMIYDIMMEHNWIF